MTERLPEITARIQGIGQLGTVVNAMRGIAGSRAQAARDQLTAVEHYAAIISAAVARGFALTSRDQAPARKRDRPVLVLFLAEQGFAGAFSERVLNTIIPNNGMFLIGSRGTQIARERGIKPLWTNPMPSVSTGIPALAGRIAAVLYACIARGEIEALEAIYSRPQSAQGIQIERRQIFPLDPKQFPENCTNNEPLLNLSAEFFLREVTADYVLAELTQAALHAFTAENEARMMAMAAAHRQIQRQLQKLELDRQLIRQGEITAEIIELAAGTQATNRHRQADAGK